MLFKKQICHTWPTGVGIIHNHFEFNRKLESILGGRDQMLPWFFAYLCAYIYVFGANIKCCLNFLKVSSSCHLYIIYPGMSFLSLCRRWPIFVMVGYDSSIWLCYEFSEISEICIGAWQLKERRKTWT